MKLRANPKDKSQLIKVVEKLDKHAIHHNIDGEAYIDPSSAASGNLDLAKLQATGGTVALVLTAASALQFYHWPLGKTLSAIVGVVSGGASVMMFAVAAKNLVDAAVWGVIAGTQKVFGVGGKLES